MNLHCSCGRLQLLLTKRQMTRFESKLLVLRRTIQRHCSKVKEWQHPISLRNYTGASQDFKYLGSMGYNGKCGEEVVEKDGASSLETSGELCQVWPAGEKEKTINKNDRRDLQKGGKTSKGVLV